jgi:hypothetical protein
MFGFVTISPSGSRLDVGTASSHDHQLDDLVIEHQRR